MCLVYLGGPEFCEKSLQPNYTLSSNVSPVMKVVLCGVPAPILHWRFKDGSSVMAMRQSINSYTYEFLINLPKLTQKTCERDLTLIATGNIVLKWRQQLLFPNCKCQAISL